jgi:hypothetical protein
VLLELLKVAGNPYGEVDPKHTVRNRVLSAREFFCEQLDHSKNIFLRTAGSVDERPLLMKLHLTAKNI